MLSEPGRPAHPEYLAPFLGAASEALFSFCVRLPCAQVPSLLQSLRAQCSAHWGVRQKQTSFLNTTNPLLSAVALVEWGSVHWPEALEPLCNFGIWELMFLNFKLLQINVVTGLGERGVELPD